jgi:hypothetical protein
VTAQDLRGARASSLAGCLRRAWYDAQDTPQEQLPKKTLRLFDIRRMQNDALSFADAEEARAAGRQIVLEEDIDWGPVTDERPLGIWTGHADYVDHTDRIVREYTGSADLSPDRRKMLQAAFYAKRLTEITGVEYGAWVVVFNPSTGDYRNVPVKWQEISWEMDNLVADLVSYLQAGIEPPRRDGEMETVCETPASGPAMFCPYAGRCFRDFVWPEMGRLEGNAEKLAKTVLALKAREGDVSLIEKDRKLVQAELVKLIQPKTKYTVPLEDGRQATISVSEVKGRRSFALGEMEKAGFSFADSPADLAPFLKEGEPSVRLNIDIYEGPNV